MAPRSRLTTVRRLNVRRGTDGGGDGGDSHKKSRP